MRQVLSLNGVIWLVVFILPPLLSGADRLAHPGPWVALLFALVTLATQPSLTPGTMVADRGDRLSALVILIGVLASMVTAILQFTLRAEVFPAAAAWWTIAGVAIGASGLAVRVWAIRTLGELFTTTVQVQPGQRVISSGPYRFIRHPAYTGTVLTCVGIALVLGSGVGVVVVMAITVPAYLYRIWVEEHALLSDLGEPYARYRDATWKLVPYLF